MLFVWWAGNVAWNEVLTVFCWEYLNEADRLEDLGVGGMLMLEKILKK